MLDWPLLLVSMAVLSVVLLIRRWMHRRRTARALQDAASESDGDFDQMMEELSEDDRVTIDDT